MKKIRNILKRDIKLIPMQVIPDKRRKEKYGYREKEYVDARSAMVETPERLEACVLEKRTASTEE